jgi:hypothetical protein
MGDHVTVLEGEIVRRLHELRIDGGDGGECGEG